jgi:hypothetical protein
VYRGLQNCTDVLEAVPGLCTETCLTACDDGKKVADIKFEEDSDIPEEEDPSAVTSPAVKAEQEVSYVYITCECYNSSDTCCVCSRTLLEHLYTSIVGPVRLSLSTLLNIAGRTRDQVSCVSWCSVKEWTGRMVLC